MYTWFHFFNVHLRNMWSWSEPNCSTSEENFLSGVLPTAIHGPLGQGCHRPVFFYRREEKKCPLTWKGHRIGWYKMGLLDRIGWEALGFIGTYWNFCLNPSGRWFGFWHMWPNDINHWVPHYMSLRRRDLTIFHRPTTGPVWASWGCSFRKALTDAGPAQFNTYFLAQG